MKKTTKLGVLLFLLVVLLTGCSRKDTEQTIPTNLGEPIDAAGTNVSLQKTSESLQIVYNLSCDDNLKPVCTNLGITFKNECLAAQKGQVVDYLGECPGEFKYLVGNTDCTSQTNLVCLSTGANAQNECVAKQFGYRVISEGRCDTTTWCVEGKYVCGVDNKTYGSACTAQKRNVAVAYEGSCITTN